MDTQEGAALAAQEPSVVYVAGGWPFSFDRARFDALSKSDRDRVEGAALAIILECEGRDGAKRRRSGKTKSAA